MFKKIGLMVVTGIVGISVVGCAMGEDTVERFETTVIQDGESMADVVARVHGVESVDADVVAEIEEYNLIIETCVEVGCEVQIPVYKK